MAPGSASTAARMANSCSWRIVIARPRVFMMRLGNLSRSMDTAAHETMTWKRPSVSCSIAPGERPRSGSMSRRPQTPMATSIRTRRAAFPAMLRLWEVFPDGRCFRAAASARWRSCRQRASHAERASFHSGLWTSSGRGRSCRNPPSFSASERAVWSRPSMLGACFASASGISDRRMVSRRTMACHRTLMRGAALLVTASAGSRASSSSDPSPSAMAAEELRASSASRRRVLSRAIPRTPLPGSWRRNGPSTETNSITASVPHRSFSGAAARVRRRRRDSM
mmetsp:Transcript_32667/g.77494  ORF Transcript_32667/g.77494 Transcript_32667/m.77494 type:complete len:281 (-) Transcript_32667:128-970(-)